MDVRGHIGLELKTYFSKVFLNLRVLRDFNFGGRKAAVALHKLSSVFPDLKDSAVDSPVFYT